MKEPAAFEKYPVTTVITFWLVALLNFAIGIYLLSLINIIFSLLYVIYIVAIELSVYREGCVSCWYYGKRCSSGRGVIAPHFFKKDDSKKFCERQVTWKNMLPTMLVTVIPVAAGLYLLSMGFTYLLIGLTIIPILTWFIWNPLVYGKLACPHCRQGRICCPANAFFGKKRKKVKK